MSERGEGVVQEDGTAWKHWRTCSRVSSGPCAGCRRETYFSCWARAEGKGVPPLEKKDRLRVLCEPCWEKRYDQEAARARIEAAAINAKDREARTAFAREEVRRRAAGEPPAEGWRRVGPLVVNDATGEKRGFF